jgi:hypothetical protein
MIPSSTFYIRKFGSYSANRRHEIDIINSKLERLTIALFGKKALEYYLQIKKIKPQSYSFAVFLLSLLLYFTLVVPVIVCTEVYVFIKLVIIYSLRNILYSKEYETLHEILENPSATEQANCQDDYNSLITYLRQEFEDHKLNKDYVSSWAAITILTFKDLKTCFSASSYHNISLIMQRDLYLVVADDIVKKLQLPTYEKYQELFNRFSASPIRRLSNKWGYYNALFASPQVQRLSDSSLNDAIYFCTAVYGLPIHPNIRKYTKQGWRLQAIPSELHLRKERQKFLKGLNLFFSDAALQCIQPNIERYLERLEVPSVIEPAVLPVEVSGIVASFF